MGQTTEEALRQYAQRRELLKLELELEVTDDRDRARGNYSAATTMGLEVIKIGLVLNGGGLVAIPAAAGLFGISAAPVRDRLIIVGLLFIVGLLTAWYSSLCAFFALSDNSDAGAARAAARRIDVMLRHGELAADQGWADESRDLKRESGRSFQRYLRWRRSSIAACLVSFIAFILGAMTGGIALVR